MNNDRVLPTVRCVQCHNAMHAWGERGDVWVCRRCGTCKDIGGWQVPKVTEYLARPEVLLSVPRRWRLALSDLIHGSEGDEQ